MGICNKKGDDKIRYIASTKKGKGNKHNYDRVFIDNHIISSGMITGKGSILTAICDGVGSLEGSDIAASIVVSNLLFLRDKTDANNVWRIIKKSAEEIQGIQKNVYKTDKIATTFAGLIVSGGKYYSINIGDTRIYKYNNEKLKLITRDHTVAQRKIDCGIVNTKNIPFGDYNTLTRYIGNSSLSYSPSIKKGFAEKGNFFLLCSDGIYKYVDDTELETILKSKNSLKEKERTIMQRAIQNGSNDDLSIALLEMTN